MAPIPFCLLVSSSDLPIGQSQTQLQDESMKQFFLNISVKGLENISKSYADENYCDNWAGITCSDGFVSVVHYISKHFGNFNIRWLPPYVKRMRITSSSQTFELQTRSFPRDVVTLALSNNQIYGNVDLTTLPEKLEKALLWGNKLSGPIDLCHLPRSLITLKLEGNPIIQDIIWYDNLPKRIQLIQLVYKSTTEAKNIGKVCARNPEDKVSHKVFRNMPKRKIH